MDSRANQGKLDAPVPPPPVTVGSVGERINALEALITLLIVKGSVYATTAELDSVQEAVRRSDKLLSTPLGREMDKLLDRLKSAVEHRERRRSQGD